MRERWLGNESDGMTRHFHQSTTSHFRRLKTVGNEIGKVTVCLVAFNSES